MYADAGEQTTNNPADLAGPAPGMPGGGLNQGMQQYPDVAPYAAKGPYIPSPEIAGNLDKPAVSTMVLS